MKTFAAALALAAGVSASYPVGGNVTYATEVVTSYETYCPGPTTLTYGQTTYTISSATTLTITDCPGGCTVTKPVYTTSSVICHTCEHPSEYPTETPVYPTETPVYPTEVPTTHAPTTYPTVAPPTNYPNTTIATSVTSEYPVIPTGGVTPTTVPENPTAIPTAGAGKLAAGAGLAGLMGLVALL
ncbi:hypothetical protein DL765_007553 [Monosporascus sp. GIB2]|nr:hypothetical protein DL765_007553 [Monosporascus sp. GIB2]